MRDHAILEPWCHLRWLWKTSSLSLYWVWRRSLPSAAHGKWQKRYCFQKTRLNIATMTSKDMLWLGISSEDTSCVSMCKCINIWKNFHEFLVFDSVKNAFCDHGQSNYVVAVQLPQDLSKGWMVTYAKFQKFSWNIFLTTLIWSF